MNNDSWIVPNWPAPARVRALCTTRLGGVSKPPYDSFNLASHVGDNPDDVQSNRQRLRIQAKLPSEPFWLEQIHSNVVLTDDFKVQNGPPPQADGAVTARSGKPLVIFTADCLPILATSRDGSIIGAFHAGWKGLYGGIVANGIAAMKIPPQDLIFWIGPAIGPEAYQVDDKLRDLFCHQNAAYERHFKLDTPGHYKMDLPACAKTQLLQLGAQDIWMSGLCTATESQRFYSYRRQNPCGRLATVIWTCGSEGG